MNTLMHCTLPQDTESSVRDLYYQGEAEVSSCGALHIDAHTNINFGTYFNILNVAKLKKYTSIRKIYLRIEYTGCMRVDIMNADTYGNTRKHAHAELACSAKDCAYIALDADDTSLKDIVFFKVYAQEKSVLFSAKYVTEASPLRDVRLGIVITTYQREAELVNNCKALLDGIRQYQLENVGVIVIDNGRTLQADQVQGAVLIHNPNYGGSGGFMRGLLHLEDAKQYSHCLFMDDDAQCTIESVFRAQAFAAYATHDRMAIAGAMLQKEQPYVQHENAAYYDTINRPLHHGLDLRNFVAVCQNEVEAEYENMYGAWWFFLFPLTAVRHYAFPFFVRGDDILFSIMNKFQIVTLNGTCCWHPCFEGKENAFTQYLALRSNMIIQTYVFHNRLKAALHVVRFVLAETVLACLTYRYQDVRIILKAYGDFLQGPEFWKKNIDVTNLRQEVLATCTVEECESADSLPRQVSCEPKIPRWLEKVLYVGTLGGHMLPDYFLDSTSVWSIERKDKGLLFRYWRKKRIAILDAQGGVCETRSLQRAAFFNHSILSLWYTLINLYNFYRKISQYKRSMSLQTREFWMKSLHIEQEF